MAGAGNSTRIYSRAGASCRPTGALAFIIIIPAGVAEIIRSFLFSQHRFAVPSSANFFRNATVVLSVLFGFRRYHYYSIIFGYVAGYLLQLRCWARSLLFRFRFDTPLAFGVQEKLSVIRTERGWPDGNRHLVAGRSGCREDHRVVSSARHTHGACLRNQDHEHHL